uniref:ATP-dependent RNA helicase n=1 Tax=Cyprinus carpio TaxID=7962 RepID=A0A8C1QQZ2_CYPCA
MQSVKIRRCTFLISKLCSLQLGWGQIAGVSACVRRVTTAGSHIQSAPPSVLMQKDEGDGSASAPQKTFNCFNICPELVETLHSQNIIHPTAVQMQAILKILKGCNILCAAETGSGKTLAYLLPIINRLQEEPFTDSERNIRAVVIVPSQELAEQVTSVARSVSKPLGLEMGVRHMRLQGEMPATVREGTFRNFQKGNVDWPICRE